MRNLEVKFHPINAVYIVSILEILIELRLVSCLEIILSVLKNRFKVKYYQSI